jgi:hypothetical protein
MPVVAARLVSCSHCQSSRGTPSRWQSCTRRSRAARPQERQRGVRRGGIGHGDRIGHHEWPHHHAERQVGREKNKRGERERAIPYRARSLATTPNSAATPAIGNTSPQFRRRAFPPAPRRHWRQARPEGRSWEASEVVPAPQQTRPRLVPPDAKGDRAGAVYCAHHRPRGSGPNGVAPGYHPRFERRGGCRRRAEKGSGPPRQCHACANGSNISTHRGWSKQGKSRLLHS